MRRIAVVKKDRVEVYEVSPSILARINLLDPAEAAEEIERNGLLFDVVRADAVVVAADVDEEVKYSFC